jgi:hypothetical protein
MAIQRNYQSRGPLGGIIGVMIILGLVYLAYLTVSSIFSILSFVAPVLFIGALLLKRSVVIDYGKWLWNTIKTDTPRGLIYGALSFFGFPVLAAYFFFRAFMSSKLKKVVDTKRQQAEEEKSYAHYEEVIEEDDDFLDLPDLNKTPQKEAAPKGKSNDSGYEDLFD